MQLAFCGMRTGGSAGAQWRMHGWQKSAGISYPEFSFGAVKDRRRRRRRVESNSAALPSSGASLHPTTPVPARCVCPGRRMWCWRREGSRGGTPSVSAHPTAGGRAEEDEVMGVGGGLLTLGARVRRSCARGVSVSATHRASEEGASPPLQRNFHRRSHRQHLLS